MAQGRVIRRIVTLFDSIEDLVAENDQRHEEDNEDHTLEQPRLTADRVHHPLSFSKELIVLEVMIPQSSRPLLPNGLIGNSSQIPRSTLTTNIPTDSPTMHVAGFSAPPNWIGTTWVQTGIRDHSDGCIVTDLSFPAYLYNKYTANPDDLEEGLFKGKILVQAYKVMFTSPSSAKNVEGDGMIINMTKVTPRSIAYIACQVQFSLSLVTSWRSIDGDFNYIQFWRTIVDFFKKAPGREVKRRVNRLLEWWSRKVFGRSHRNDIGDTAKANMSVNALAKQRAQCDDMFFDSP
ncbi:hypothetical protein EDD22DRAFT_851406 [Suillus occidentalis]|nr:hypothetical protein EDD22DRAFT_851406 [Suillus occidentalis]